MNQQLPEEKRIDIDKVVWDREHEIWVDTNDCRVTLMLPPSMELFDQEFQVTGLTGKR